jgi:hypothetical protein
MNGAPDVTRPPRPVRKPNFITNHDQEVQCATRSFLHYMWEFRDRGLNFRGRARDARGQFPGQLAWQVLKAMGRLQDLGYQVMPRKVA